MAHTRRAIKKAPALEKPAVQIRARRPFLWPIRLLASLLNLALLVTTCSLPIPVAFLLVSADAAAVTEGCETKICCTALCYVDGNGVHHCVHKHSNSCKRGTSARESNINPILLTTLVTAPDSEEFMPALDPTGWILLQPEFQATQYPATLVPPPK
jgi:hypothetical protein